MLETDESPETIFSSERVIGGKVYAALRSLDCKLGKYLNLAGSRELQHAMLLLEVPSLPGKLLCYEFGKHSKADNVKYSVVPCSSDVLKHEIEHVDVDVAKGVKVCDVTAEAKRFAFSDYKLLASFVNKSNEQQFEENNCQTFLDHMFKYVTGVSNVATRHILASSPAPLDPLFRAVKAVVKGFKAAAQYAHLNLFSLKIYLVLQ